MQLSLTERVRQFIDEHYVPRKRKSNKITSYSKVSSAAKEKEKITEHCRCYNRILRAPSRPCIDDFINERWMQIGDKMIKFIEARGEDYVEVYHAAEISSALWYKYVNGKNKPSRDSMYRMALVMELDFPEAKQFLRIGGYSFTDTSRRDLAMHYFFENGIYDYEEVNKSLDELDLEPLFSEE